MLCWNLWMIWLEFILQVPGLCNKCLNISLRVVILRLILMSFKVNVSARKSAFFPFLKKCAEFALNMQKRCAEFVNITRAESSVLAQNCGIPSVSASINAMDGSRGSMCSGCPSICTCVGRGIPTDLPSASGLCRVIFATQKLGTFVYSWAEMTDEVTWWMRPVTTHSSTSDFTTLLHLFNKRWWGFWLQWHQCFDAVGWAAGRASGL